MDASSRPAPSKKPCRAAIQGCQRDVRHIGGFCGGLQNLTACCAKVLKGERHLQQNSKSSSTERIRVLNLDRATRSAAAKRCVWLRGDAKQDVCSSQGPRPRYCASSKRAVSVGGPPIGTVTAAMNPLRSDGDTFTSLCVRFLFLLSFGL